MGTGDVEDGRGQGKDAEGEDPEDDGAAGEVDFEDAMKGLKGDDPQKYVDDAAFARAMRDLGVSKPKRRKPGAPAAPGTPEPPAHVIAEDDAESFLAAMESLEVPEPKTRGAEGRPAGQRTLLHGTPATLQRRIKHGEITAEGELDLHGLRIEEARQAVGRFVSASRRQGRVTVRIICGRGLHSKGEVLLRDEVPRWLTLDMSDDVRIAVPAPTSQGGRGVLYAFLRPA